MKMLRSSCVVVLGAAVILAPAITPFAHASGARLEAPNISTSLNEQQSVTVTVYNR